MVGVIAKLNNSFPAALFSGFKAMFGVEIVTSYDLFTGNIVSTRVDSEDLNREQCDYLRSFESGYLAAMDVVENMNIGM